MEENRARPPALNAALNSSTLRYNIGGPFVLAGNSFCFVLAEFPFLSVSALQILQCLHDLLNEDEAQTSDIWTSLPSGQDDHVSGLLQTSMALMKRLLADAQVKIY
jgi:hypothetical protein